jgi:hypothetical protein
MAVHILRDFTPVNAGYQSNSMNFTSYQYALALFMHRVLGYTVAGQSGFNLTRDNSQASTVSSNTAIAAGSNGQSLPQSTINVVSTTGFPVSGMIWVTTSDGVQIVKYSGTTATTFTNCTGGTGTMSSGFNTTIAAGSNGASLPQATINVASTTGFPTSGTIYVQSSGGIQTITYTGTTATSFTGCTGGTGTLTTGNSVASAGVGGVAAGVNKITAAAGNPVIITTQFPHGMSTGDYTAINCPTGAQYMYGIGSNLGNFGPYKVEVISATQFRMLWGVLAGAFDATRNNNILPQGLLIASGTGASINFAGAPSVNAVQVPTTARTVVPGTAPSTGDVGRILVIKSNLYPTKNSGVYKVTTVNTASNSYTIDYRSSDAPPPETGMSWWLYEVESFASQYFVFQDQNRMSGISVTAASNTTPIQINVSVSAVSYFETGQQVTITGVTGNTAANGTWVITRIGAGIFTLNGSSGNGTYTGSGTASVIGYTGGNNTGANSRILLQSPHASGWQARFAIEPFNTGAVLPYSSAAVGLNGTPQGDFPVGGITTHMAQFLNAYAPSNTPYQYTIPGASNETDAPRITVVGDDTGRNVFLYARIQAAGTNGVLTFGLPENEPNPLPPNSNRIFVYGSINANTLDWGGIQMRFGVFNNNCGFAYRDINPEIACIAGLINADGVTVGAVPNYSSNAGDCPFTGTTELIPWEIWSGVATDPVSGALPYPASGATVYTVDPRFMGTAPFIRQGRTNFGSFTLSTENTASFTVNNATNASPIQITTTATNSLVTGQTVVISGVLGNTAANGTFVVTRIDGTNFTLNGTTGNGNYTSGGTGNGTPGWLHLQNGIYLSWNGAGGLTP